MILGIDPTKFFGSSEELKQHILPRLIALVKPTEGIDNVWQWQDGTIEINVEVADESPHTVYLREGLVYTDESRDFPDIDEHNMKIFLPMCDRVSLCFKNCGCGCLVDMGYMFAHPPLQEDREEASHCKKDHSLSSSEKLQCD